MSRFIHQLPFSPLYDFKVCRVTTINGVGYTPGDMLGAEARDALGERRLRQLYERRTISPVAPGVVPEVPAPAPAAASAEPVADQARIEGGADEQHEPDDSLIEPGATGARAEHRGFGRWYVVQPDGSEDGPMTREAAQAAVA